MKDCGPGMGARHTWHEKPTRSCEPTASYVYTAPLPAQRAGTDVTDRSRLNLTLPYPTPSKKVSQLRGTPSVWFAPLLSGPAKGEPTAYICAQVMHLHQNKARNLGLSPSEENSSIVRGVVAWHPRTGRLRRRLRSAGSTSNCNIHNTRPTNGRASSAPGHTQRLKWLLQLKRV